ncbi:hypothetical protein LA080_014702 [Diaporthe eres]|uniref:Ribosomal RNA methyltransferase FtsJ domain-containing protein n=1 Tax=Diaporthe vaccinii TaxID=105482 RepID=A0ABR4E0X4_9PEZI|nr:hypothetical protein LA080_014702 [Diaporthe eres]
MASPSSRYCTLKAQFHQATAAAKDGKMPTDNTILDEPEENPVVLHAIATIDQYLMDNSPVYRDLQQLRAKGWKNPEGDRFFEKQQRRADENSEETVHRLNDLMEDIAKEMQCFTRAFTIQTGGKPQRVLDLCMAPGTYLAKALERNPAAHAVAFTLPPSQGGLVPIISETVRVVKCKQSD